MLNWLQQFDTFCFLDNAGYPNGFDGCLAGAGIRSVISGGAGDAATGLQGLGRDKRWRFGHLSYDLPGSDLRSTGSIGFPAFYFFEPEIVLHIREELCIYAEDPQKVFREIDAMSSVMPVEKNRVSVTATLDREHYVRIIEQLKKHIRRGDCYEINFCQEFFAGNVSLSPLAVYARLLEVSPNPFSAFYRLGEKWLLCASPERFLAKRGQRIFSQPMKGTASRNPDDPVNDQALRDSLYLSQKERSENVMVVDLVRNDLSRVSEPGTVKVDELFGVYSYPNVHQMVSTISGTLKKDVSFAEIIEACFPMGSMTGAPKRRVMELIRQYELSPRGLFSGSVGYIDPLGNFDLNVVIRSILYNASDKYLSYRVGSGITFYSDPAREWDECLLKARALVRVLES